MLGGDRGGGGGGGDGDGGGEWRVANGKTVACGKWECVKNGHVKKEVRIRKKKGGCETHPHGMWWKTPPPLASRPAPVPFTDIHE